MYIIVLINYVYYKTNIEILIAEIHLKLKKLLNILLIILSLKTILGHNIPLRNLT